MDSTPKFHLNSILRGVQLTLVGAMRVLQNPSLLSFSWFRLAAMAIGLGLALRLVLSIPTAMVRLSLWTLSVLVDLERTSWDERLVNSVDFVSNSVLQLPFFLMSLIHHTAPGNHALDQCFMESLSWVDQTHLRKHEGRNETRVMYHPNLVLYSSLKPEHQPRSLTTALPSFFVRQGRKAAVSLVVFGLSFLPFFGRFVVPAASFVTFRNAVGPAPASLIFGVGLLLPKEYLIMFLQTYYTSRSFSRQLLKPYFSRIRFNADQKRLFLMERQDVLFGFSLGFFILLKVPLLGTVPVVYGIAEASTAYLITKITDPPPAPGCADAFVESQVRWQNKNKFLRLPFHDLDLREIRDTSKSEEHTFAQYEKDGKMFT